MISFPFLNDLKNTPKTGWPAVVKKHGLLPRDLEIMAGLIKEGKLEDEWFNQLYIVCTGCGLSKAHLIFEKYGIIEECREALNEKLYKKWVDETNRGKFNN